MSGAGLPAAVEFLVGWPRQALTWLDRQPAHWLALIPLLLVAIAGALTFDPRVYPGGDNALYWALARSLVETGEYRDIGAPGSPFETSIPWGFPALIALGMWVLPDGYPYLKLVCWASMVGAFACLWGLLQFVLRGHRGLALAAIVLLALNHRLLVYASLLLTEAPFLLCSMGALLAFEVYRHRWADRWWGVMPAALLAAYGYLVRPAGIALLVALLGYLALSRRFRALAVALAIVLVVAGGWHARSMAVPSDEENLYLSYLVKRSKYQTDEQTVDARGLVERLTHNARAYAVGPLHRLSVGTKWRDKETISPVVLPMLVMIALGYALSLARAGPVHLYVPMYLGVILLWLPESVKDRYLAMVFPLLLPLALLGLHGTLAFRWPRAAAWAVLVVFGVMGYYQAGRMMYKIPRYRAVQVAYADGQHEVGRRRSHRSYVHMCEWLRDHAPRDAILGARKPRLAYLYSGRKALRTTFSSDADEVHSWLVEHEIDYVLLDRLDSQVDDTRVRMLPAQLRYHEHFADVYATFLGDRVARFSLDPEQVEEARRRRPLGKQNAARSPVRVPGDRDPPTREGASLGEDEEDIGEEDEAGETAKFRGPRVEEPR